MIDCPNCLGMCDFNITDKIEQFNNLPYLSLMSPVTNVPHLTNSDVDLNMPADQNFNYYNIHDFHSNYDINECSSNDRSFSALNCNIRNLAANYDNFIHMLTGLNFPFTLSFFQPHILQPTRITDHSSTLINNIFFNSIEHFTISGNIPYRQLT